MSAVHGPGCERDCGGTWICPGCERDCGWCMGCTDDMPEYCDDCWNEAQASKSGGEGNDQGGSDATEKSKERVVAARGWRPLSGHIDSRVETEVSAMAGGENPANPTSEVS